MTQTTITGRIAPDRWPTELPLFTLVVVISVVAWMVIVISIIGLVYGFFIALFLFISQLAFTAHIRGSGVRLGPDQLPDLHARVVELSRAMDLDPPETYLMQAGGALNAFATRFLRRHIVVLYSDLLEACGDDTGARDMIIAHELGHVRCGHLRWRWLTLPGQLIPFLGGALARAREYTCDRFGLLGAGDARSAVHGLAILSAGPRFAPDIDLRAFVRQRSDLDSGFMTLGEWMGTHPPLSKRIAALDSSLTEPGFSQFRGRATATAILAVGAIGGTLVTVMAGALVVAGLHAAQDAALNLEPRTGGASTVAADMAAARAQVETDLETLSAFIAAEWGSDGLPETLGDIEDRWNESTSGPFPMDPFDGYMYGYVRVGNSYRLWSSGPDGESGTEDDLSLERSAPTRSD